MTIWHRPRHGEIPNSLLDLELPLEPPQLVVWSIRTGYVPRPSITTLQSRPPPGRRLAVPPGPNHMGYVYLDFNG
jgi:hypothetical protein